MGPGSEPAPGDPGSPGDRDRPGESDRTGDPDRSASFEFGYAVGKGKRGAVLMLDKYEPELMYRGNPILTTMPELFEWAGAEPK